MPTERIIGIDFGTSTSVVRVKTYEDGKPVNAPEFADYVRFDGKSTLPTLVFYLDDGTVLAGYEAENAACGYEGELFQNFKLNLVSGNKEARDKAIRLTKDFFRYIYSAYNDQRDFFTPVCDKETTYVSYPAKWPKEIAKLMVDIASEAGFQNVVGLDEPTAALYAVLVQQGGGLKGFIHQGKSVNMLMIDMGAGTTDLVLCKYTPGAAKEVEILNTWPKADSEIMFGGREIDDKLCGYIKDYLVSCGLPDTNELIKMCLPQCKGWKEGNVSGALKKPGGAVESCGFTGMFLMGYERKTFPPINREVFEHLLEGYINQYPALIHGCIVGTGGMRPEDIDLVILTGGHSQWYFASEMLDGSITRYGAAGLPGIMSDPSRVVRLSLPQETVALGLVYQRLKVEVEPTPIPEPKQKKPIQAEPKQMETKQAERSQKQSDTPQKPTNSVVLPVPANDTETVLFTHGGNRYPYYPGKGFVNRVTAASGTIKLTNRKFMFIDPPDKNRTNFSVTIPIHDITSVLLSTDGISSGLFFIKTKNGKEYRFLLHKNGNLQNFVDLINQYKKG